MALPAHQRLPEDDTDDELSDEQIQQLLEEAEHSLRERQAAAQHGLPDAPLKLPKLNPGHIADSPSLRTVGGVTRADPSKLLDQKQKSLAEGIKKIEDPVLIKKQKLEEKKATAGSQWFNLPRTELTPELRADLQLLKMRSVLDPHRHYKKMDSKADVPAFSQVGTIIEGPTEYYNGRINKKDRKRTFVEEALAQESQSGRIKNKYGDIMQKKSSGKKAFYKALKAKRSNGVKKR